MLLWHSPQWDMEISPLTFGWASSLWLSWSVWHLPLYLSRYCSLFSCTFSVIYFVIVISHVWSFTSCQFYYHKCCIVRINSQQLTKFNGNVFWLFIFKVIKVNLTKMQLLCWLLKVSQLNVKIPSEKDCKSFYFIFTDLFLARRDWVKLEPTQKNRRGLWQTEVSSQQTHCGFCNFFYLRSCHEFFKRVLWASKTWGRNSFTVA